MVEGLNLILQKNYSHFCHLKLFMPKLKFNLTDETNEAPRCFVWVDLGMELIDQIKNMEWLRRIHLSWIANRYQSPLDRSQRRPSQDELR